MLEPDGRGRCHCHLVKRYCSNGAGETKSLERPFGRTAPLGPTLYEGGADWTSHAQSETAPANPTVQAPQLQSDDQHQAKQLPG